MNAPLVFDQAVFRALCDELGEADTIEVLQAFLADTAGKLTHLAANSEDRAMIKLEAHSIKSSAATFGFNELSGLAKQLEFSSATLPPEGLRKSVGGLRNAFDAIRQLAEANLLNANHAMTASPRVGARHFG
jgi:HPt (histidine-containing phosphotransfer) domain-containing protein